MAFDKTAFLAAAQKKLDAAKALMSDADRDEQKAREEAETMIAQAKTEARAARELALARRLDAAQEKLGSSVAVRAVAIQEFDDTFIVQRDGAAHARFEKLLADSQTDKKIDLAMIKRNYAIDVVYDWNGITNFDATTTNGLDLRSFFEANPAVVTPIVNVALALNGAFAEERKS